MNTALVTGSEGFIGRHMTAELESRGYEVAGFDYDPRRNFEDRLYDIASGTRCDLVVHCAYVVGGRATIDGKNTALMENLNLDSTLFKWAVATEQKRVLYFSSSAVYPTVLQMDRSDGPLYEDDYFPQEAGHADSHYGFAKAAGERMADVARQNGVAVSVVRPFSGYGEDQSLDYPFPSIVARAATGDLSVWGPPGQTRDWIHVSDVVKGALAVVDSGTTDPVNLCTGYGTEMGELAKLIDRMANGIRRAHVTYDVSKPTGVFYRVGDPARFHRYYQPTVSLEEGVARALKGVK